MTSNLLSFSMANFYKAVNLSTRGVTVTFNLFLESIGLLLLTCVTLFWSNDVMAQRELLQCRRMAAQMNKSLPAKIDFMTTLQMTSCLEDKGEIYFQYFHVISDPASLPRNIQSKSKASARSQYCSNKDFRNALKLYNFDFYYVDVSNRPIFSFTLKASDC